MKYLLHCMLVALTTTAAFASEEAPVDFETQIQPVFAENCIRCHGEKKQKGGLRLDSPASIRKGGDSGEPVFIVGNRMASHIFKLISAADPEETMPPDKSDLLPSNAVELIGAWIDQGARMPGEDKVAKLTTDHWSFQPVAKKHRHTNIDDFLNEALKRKALIASPAADRRTLIRRLYLSILGLPPTPEEVEQFLNDTSPDAWRKLVERTLSSNHFGERMARHWLDIVRFAETNGFETNRERLNAYKFRDYVINAFNSDMPYDQFIREQIAGDAFDAEIATGFLVAGPYDIVKSPDINLTLMQRQDELADMINTTGTAFLGLTIGCAKCHNHKFDPISQKDYYAFQAIFAGVSYGDKIIRSEPNEKVRKEIAELQAKLTSDENELDKLSPLAAAVNAKGNTEIFPTVTAESVRFTINQTNVSEPCIDELQIFSASGENVALTGTPTSSGDYQGSALHRLEHINDGEFGNDRSWISNQNGRGWVQIDFARSEAISRIKWARDSSGRFSDRLPIDYVIEISTNGSDWKVVASSADHIPFGSKEDPDAFIESLPPADAAVARTLFTEIQSTRAKIESLNTASAVWVGNFSQPGPTHRLYRGEPTAKREEVAPDALEVMGTLGLTKQTPEQERRVALANWISSSRNPLTARVMVNRIWQFVFGTGIVDTPSDFGLNGTNPVHPELLDWLADEFVKSGWSMKHMIQLMLETDAFQRSSSPNPDAQRIDSDSRYLWRFPPHRLEAEAIRDSILAVAGTLDRRMGGPGFYLSHVDRENVVHYHAKEETGPAEWRRMIYLFKIRQEQDAVFGAFDCPDGNSVIPKRNRSTTPLQALNLFNSRFTVQQAEKFAERLGDGSDRVQRAFELLYGRLPTAAETADCEKFIASEGLVAFCRAMFNTSEFLFIF